MRRLIVLVLLFPLLFNSCEDVSISKKDLLTKSWSLNEITLNGEIYNHEAIYLINNIYTFFEDETIEIIITQNTDVLNGTWQILNNNTELTIAFSGVMYEYTIEKLDNSNLWLSRTDSDNVYLFKYSKALLECFT